MAQIEQAIRLLGLANRAGKLTLGKTATAKALHRRQCRLLILAHDVSDRAAEKISSDAARSKVQIRYAASKDELGQIFGRNEVGIVGVTDAGFAKSLSELLNTSAKHISVKAGTPKGDNRTP